MSEEQAFDMLKFLMYDLGIRQQYKPDMISLQVSAQTPHIILLKRKARWLYLQDICVNISFTKSNGSIFFWVLERSSFASFGWGKKIIPTSIKDKWTPKPLCPTAPTTFENQIYPPQLKISGLFSSIHLLKIGPLLLGRSTKRWSSVPTLTHRTPAFPSC